MFSMRRMTGSFMAGGMLAVILVFAEHASGTAPDRSDGKQRVQWTTGKIVGSPDPADPYTIENAFPRLTLFEPLAVSLVPGSNDFGVATRPGKLFTFENRPDVDHAELLLDVGKTVYGLAFHPQFQQNGYFYVMYVLDPRLTSERGSRVSRFTRQSETGKADLSSELVILEWPSGGHNGGCIRFGPDGYLYIATGDGSGIADEFKTGQDLSDLLGAILRIDVNGTSADRAYAIPPSNPFIDTPGARAEIWSFGHRQVWKFSFDRHARLWAGEVGQDLWEMVYLVERGGNYGWSVREGSHAFRPERPKGPGDFVAPLVEHPHSDFRSVTGGYVYESDRLPDLKGAYIYGDYDTGKLWMLRYEDGQVREHRQIADCQLRLVEFAQDASGEVYLIDFAGGGFHRLVPAPQEVATAPFPRTLSETGLFTSTKDHVPAPGVLSYSVNSPLWSDGAEKERFIALPGDAQIEFDDVIYPHGPDYPDVGWRFPDGTVLVKTFSLEMEKGNPQSRRRLETRLLHYRQMPGNDDEYGAQYWFGYTYVWNEDQTDAELLGAEGLDRKLIIRDSTAAGGEREQIWRFPSRAECTLCHTMASKYVLGITTLQMNKLHDYDGELVNQLTRFEQLGLFKDKLPKSPEQLPRLVDVHDAGQPLELRARSYLHANCAHCHRKWGGGNAEFELHASPPLEQLGIVNTRPGQGSWNLPDARILAPGSPDRSLLLHRMRLAGLGRMPHVGSHVVDQQAVDLIEQWIAQLSTPESLGAVGALHPRIAAPAEPEGQ